jgi:hypothetical protein
MRHAGAEALEALSALLDEIRQRNGLTERKRGIFYRRSKSFLHFHEDLAGLFADLSMNGGSSRYPVNTPDERQNFILALDLALAQ